MIDHLTLEARVGMQQALDGCEDELADVHQRVGVLLGTSSDRTGFCTSTTSIWARVVDRSARTGGRILLCALEWGDQLRHAQCLADRVGMTVDMIPADEAFDPVAWQARIDEDVTAICVPLVTSIGGRMLPVERIARLARPKRTILLVDAAQGVGRAPTNELLAGCDVVVATTRKWLRAPRQTAVFSLSERAQLEIGLTVQELTGSIPNVALQLGLGQALRDASGDDGSLLNKDIFENILEIDGAIRDGMSDRRPDLHVLKSDAIGTVTISVPEKEREAIAKKLAQASIVAKWCNPEMEEPEAGHDPGFVPLRVSPHSYNSAKDVDAFLDAIGSAQR